MNIIENINLKFTSGNNTPVEITYDEWIAVKAFYDYLMYDNNDELCDDMFDHEVYNHNLESFYED